MLIFMEGLVWLVLAFAPLFILGFYVGRSSPRLLFFGGIGWILALILRIIPLNLFQMLVPDLTAIIIYSAVMAGLFEEGMRFWLVKRTKALDFKAGLTFGLGWGIAEALVVFFPNVLLSPKALNLGLFDLLPGIFERYVAVLAHVALTFIIIKAISYREYLFVAIVAHAVLDLIAGLTYYVMRLSVWQVEGLVAAYTLLLSIYAFYVIKKVY
ncbi:MAG: YhfC family intramembrane metalloprotease [Candidatus Methanomethyliaceae archaeon]|nr:YhfC family intramembrane metalloprotease [Candidatus Methanomethyliaceae archaeon]